jgi:hypothetical protein
VRSLGRNGRREKGTCTHTWAEGRLRNGIARRQQPAAGKRPARSGPATAGRGVAFFRGCSVCGDEGGCSVDRIGEPDPRGFSSEYAGKRRPLRRRLKARNWMPCGSHRAGEDTELRSVVRCAASQAAVLQRWARRARMQCCRQDLRIWRPVSTPCPPK